MATHTDPAEVVRAVAAGVSRLMAGNLSEAERERQLDALAGLYAETTDVRHPFAPLGDRPLRTRAELREHFAAAGVGIGGIRRFEPVNQVVHRTADPEVVVFEFAYAVAIGDTESTVPCIFAVRVRDGAIVESRDHADHLGMARAFGGLPALATALAGTSGAATVARRMHAAFNTLDLAAVDDIFAADFYSHPLRTRGPAAVKERWQAMRAAAPDLRTEIVDLIADGDRATIRSALSDGSGELIEIIRVESGRIAELWGARAAG